MKGVYSCYASAAFGLEGLVAGELRKLGLSEVKAENGGVRFNASAEELYLCNLKLHFCDSLFSLFPGRNLRMAANRLISPPNAPEAG